MGKRGGIITSDTKGWQNAAGKRHGVAAVGAGSTPVNSGIVPRAWFRSRGEPGAQSGGQSRSPFILAYAGGYIDCASFHSVQTYVVETASVSLVGRRHEAHRGHLVDAGSIPAPHSILPLGILGGR